MQKLDAIHIDPQSPINPVGELRFHDQIKFDPAPIRQLYQDKGHQHAEEHICNILENIARLLERLNRAIAGHQNELAAALARDLADLANDIGLGTVGIVASHICDAAYGDPTSLNAILARLKRVTEPSMIEIWSDQRGAT